MLSLFLSVLNTDEEKSSFEKLYYEYRNLLFFIAKGILQEDSLAEDAVQETFLRVAKNYEKIHEPVSDRTKRFITVIVKNVCIDMLRKNKREQMVEDVDDVIPSSTLTQSHYAASEDDYFDT